MRNRGKVGEDGEKGERMMADVRELLHDRQTLQQQRRLLHTRCSIEAGDRRSIASPLPAARTFDPRFRALADACDHHFRTPISSEGPDLSIPTTHGPKFGHSDHGDGHVRGRSRRQERHQRHSEQTANERRNGRAVQKSGKERTDSRSPDSSITRPHQSIGRTTGHS